MGTTANGNESVRLYGDDVIDQLHDEAEAVNAAWFRRKPEGRTHRFAAELMHVNPGHLSRVIGGDAGMPVNKAASFCRTLGNAIWLQYVARSLGLAVVPEAEYQRLLLNEQTRQTSMSMSWRVDGFTPPR